MDTGSGATEKTRIVRKPWCMMRRNAGMRLCPCKLALNGRVGWAVVVEFTSELELRDVPTVRRG